MNKRPQRPQRGAPKKPQGNFEGKPKGQRNPDEKSEKSGYKKKPYSKSADGRKPRFEEGKKRAYSQNPGARKTYKRKEEEPEKPMDVRLNRYIANAGICSRREADDLIAAGKVSVNGKVITEMGYRVKPTDRVKFEGKVLKSEKLQYVLLNKPKGFITTVKDERDRKTVMQLVEKACEERIYPVGRLDRQTTGLLLFTNDGDLAKKLTHPSYRIKKIYQVELNKPITQADFDAILNGLELEDGPIMVDDLAVITPDKQSLGIEIHSGRNRIIRRIFEHLGYSVEKLDRVMFGNLTKKNLPRGHWRHLTEKEVGMLK